MLTVINTKEQQAPAQGKAPVYPKWNPATSSFVVRRRKEETNIFLLLSTEREGDDEASQGGITSKTTVLSTGYGHSPSPDTMMEIAAATYSLRNGAELVPTKTVVLCASCKPFSGPSWPHV